MQIMVEFAFLGAQGIDGFHSMDHRCMVAPAKCVANFRIAVGCYFTAQPHGNLARASNGARAFL